MWGFWFGHEIVDKMCIIWHGGVVFHRSTGLAIVAVGVYV